MATTTELIKEHEPHEFVEDCNCHQCLRINEDQSILVFDTDQVTVGGIVDVVSGGWQWL